ncbi:hypothetical protein [Aquimarina aggregata]|uniref:hypothetical protein n=1 Tax=Aquimarina aggregata TaxID=1642818 RepID=UPI00249272D6|nr:hypothetical protein [Aquimarina aggregata]
MKIIKNHKLHTSTHYLTKLLLFFTVSFIVLSCEGEDGAIGPQGEQGLQGNTGESGTANIIYSEWINTGLSDNITSVNTSFTFDAPEINAEILNSGIILVYGRFFDTNNGIRVYQLPITVGVGSTRLSYLFNASSGKIEVRINSAEIIGTNDFLQQYRYVIIPQDQASKSSLDYTKMSYQEIKNILEVPFE